MSGTYENYSLSVLVLINFAINHDDQFCENQDVTIEALKNVIVRGRDLISPGENRTPHFSSSGSF